MMISRWLKHLCSGHWQVRRSFPVAALQAIEAAIRAAEAAHHGQIRFAVEAGLDIGPLFENKTARERAIEIFSRLRVWDTEHNNGVLIYLLLADHDVEIIADRGVDARVGREGWEHICRAMEAEFRAGRFEAGVLTGISAVSAHLREHYPRQGVGANELPDQPVLL
ncbi:MAG: TPM domain-containing protein [Proteobacteria bacterium]|nr:TPM domain-containing protein [Pseudomonadota bacterium]